MKAWYDDIDCATLQRIKAYSAFNDATSKNLMIQTMYEYREKEIKDFKKTNHELADLCIQRKKHIKDLGKENAELNDKLNNLASVAEVRLGMWQKYEKENKDLKEKINKATEILKVVLNKWKEERWILQSEKEVKMIENVMKEAEAF